MSILQPKYLYLLLDVLSILVPFIASFYSKAPFYKQWKHLWLAIVIPAALFIAWDEIFTTMGVWGFNPRYLTGIYIGSLPLEEVLFFICIPYACIFTYFALNHIIEKDYLLKYTKLISTILIITLLILGIYFSDRLYTSYTFIALAIFLFYIILIKKSFTLSRFYFSYLFILIPFFFVNGILTGSFIEGEVVWYNDKENLGIRMGTIPVEDTFYGMLLILMNIYIFETLKQRPNKQHQV